MSTVRKILSLKEHIDLTINETSKIIRNYTVQLFKKDSIIEPIMQKPFACGVLFKIEDHKFILTAKHLLDNSPTTDIGIMINDIFHILEGNVKYSIENNFNLDVAVWKLNNDVAKDLQQKYEFLQLPQIQLNHEIVNAPQYLLTGYPISKSKINPVKKIIKVESFTFLSEPANIETYKTLKFETYLNIIVNYNKNRIVRSKSNIITQGPKPIGLSGSGLWYLDNTICYEKNAYKLIGILTDWYKTHNIIISTRIDVITEMLRQILKLNIPKTKLFNIRFH